MKSIFIWVLIALIVGGAVLFVLAGKSSPEAVAEQFMRSLDTKDLDSLVKLSYFENPPPDLREQWDHCVNSAARNYIYVWKFERIRFPTEGRAVISVMFVTYLSPKGEELPEPIELPLIETKDGWKVNMDEIPRKFFPYLPH